MNDYSRIPLSILVFGPSPAGTGVDPHLRALLEKRTEIREALRSHPAHHTVHFGEEIADGRLPAPIADNKFFQEQSALRDYDLVVVLVYSPGTNVELGQIASRPEFAAKALLFLDEAFAGSYADNTCKAAEYLKGEYRPYRYPTDLHDCHLLGFVHETVERVQFVKFLS